MNKYTLDIIIIDNDLEALALRSTLEWWGVKVNMYYIGKSQDIVNIFPLMKKVRTIYYLPLLK